MRRGVFRGHPEGVREQLPHLTAPDPIATGAVLRTGTSPGPGGCPWRAAFPHPFPNGPVVLVRPGPPSLAESRAQCLAGDVGGTGGCPAGSGVGHLCGGGRRWSGPVRCSTGEVTRLGLLVG